VAVMTKDGPPAGPPAGPAVLEQALRHLSTRPSDPLSTTIGAVNASRPVEVFTLKLDDIHGSNFLGKAVSTGWRYLVVGDGPVAMADVRGTMPEFANLTRGKLAERFEEAANLAQSTYGASATQFEIRVLEVPSLYVIALWLRAEAEQIDKFIWIADGVQADASIAAEDPSFLDKLLARGTARRSGSPAVP